MEIVSSELLSLAMYYCKESYARHRSQAVAHSKFWDSTCFIDYEGDRQIVSFPGSASLRDWIVNGMAFAPLRYKRKWCHGGFRGAHSAIWKDIDKELDPSKETIVTGHSQGGAFAELSLLRMRNFEHVHLITYGKPNVFTKWSRPAFPQQYTLVSVVHGSDMVARIPRIAYRPNKNQDLLYFGNDGNDIWNPSAPHKAADRILHDPTDRVTDHMLPEYDKRQTRYLKESNQVIR